MCVCVCVQSLNLNQLNQQMKVCVCGPRIFWSCLDDHQTRKIIIIKRSHRFSKLNQTLPNTIIIGGLVQYLKTFSCCTGPPFTPRGDKKHCQTEKQQQQNINNFDSSSDHLKKTHLRKLPLAVLYNKISITVFLSLTFSPPLSNCYNSRKKEKEMMLFFH